MRRFGDELTTSWRGIDYDMIPLCHENPLHMNASAPVAVFTATIESVDDGTVVVSVPGNAYRITMAWGGVDTPSPGRVKGVIEAHALRVHEAAAGGRFIEPVMGVPRIVSGTVEAIDEDAATVALRSVVPIHVALEDRDDLAKCMVGSLVNFHVRSDVRFSPAG